MATETTTQVTAAPEPAPVKPSAKKSRSKKRVVKKPAAKKSAAKKNVKKRVSRKSKSKKSTVKKIAPKKRAGKKSASKKAAPQKGKVKQQPTPQKISKAQAIRDSANELGRKARPKDIIAALAEKGISVVSAQVSMVLKAAGLRRGRRRKNVVMAVAARNASRNGDSQTFNVNDLIQVRQLAAKVGGIEKLKESVAALEKLQSIWIGV